MLKELKNIAADVAFCKHHIIHNETLAVLKFVDNGNKSYQAQIWQDFVLQFNF